LQQSSKSFKQIKQKSRNRLFFIAKKLLTNVIICDNIIIEDNERDDKMKNNIIKAMMHPIRIKIIQELGVKKQATTKELQSSCGDCAQATLYRHIKDLLKYEIIVVDSENYINGIIEKVYKLNDDLNKMILGDPKKLTKDDYLRMFTQFLLSVLTDFNNYFEQDEPMKGIQSNIGFTSTALYLSDEEMMELMQEVSIAFQKRIEYKQEEKRKLRKISQIVTTIYK
jgi:DNA-binding HxlR family transcriptional regulator